MFEQTKTAIRCCFKVLEFLEEKHPVPEVILATASVRVLLGQLDVCLAANHRDCEDDENLEIIENQLDAIDAFIFHAKEMLPYREKEMTGGFTSEHQNTLSALPYAALKSVVTILSEELNLLDIIDGEEVDEYDY